MSLPSSFKSPCSARQRGQGILSVMLSCWPYLAQGRHGTIPADPLSCPLLLGPISPCHVNFRLLAAPEVPPVWEMLRAWVPTAGEGGGHRTQWEPSQSPPGAVLATAGHEESIISAGLSTLTSPLLPAAVKGSSVTTFPLKCNLKVPHQLPRCLDLFQAARSSLSWKKERSHVDSCCSSLAKVDYFQTKAFPVCSEPFRLRSLSGSCQDEHSSRNGYWGKGSYLHRLCNVLLMLLEEKLAFKQQSVASLRIQGAPGT